MVNGDDDGVGMEGVKRRSDEIASKQWRDDVKMARGKSGKWK